MQIVTEIILENYVGTANDCSQQNEIVLRADKTRLRSAN